MMPHPSYCYMSLLRSPTDESANRGNIDDGLVVVTRQHLAKVAGCRLASHKLARAD